MNKRSCEYCKYLPAYGEGAYCRLMDRPIKSSILFEKGCQHFEELKQTVFDKITSSEEVLAQKFVYFDYSVCDDNGIGYPWCSTLFEDGGHFETEEKAITATIEELRKEAKDEISDKCRKIW